MTKVLMVWQSSQHLNGVVDVSFKIVMSSLLCAYLPDAEQYLNMQPNQMTQIKETLTESVLMYFVSDKRL